MVDDPMRTTASVFARWWSGMTDAAHEGANADRKGLAELRRVGLVDVDGVPTPDTIAAIEVSGFRRLYHDIKPLVRFGPGDLETDLAVAAATLARVRRNVGPAMRTATMLGGRDEDDRAMKEGRFLRLMRVETPGDLFDQARRLVALLNGEAPVGELGASLLFWRRTPAVRRAWARAYYHLDQTNKNESDSAEQTEGAIP